MHAAALLAEALWVNYTNGAAPSVVAPGQRLGESSFRDRRAGADHRPLITAAAPGSATGHPRVLKSSSPGDCARPGPGSKAAPRPAERADDDDEGYRVHPADRGLSQRSLERGRPSGGRWLAALVHWGSTARGVQKPTPPRGLLLNGNDVERGTLALIKTDESIPATVEH